MGDPLVNELGEGVPMVRGVHPREEEGAPVVRCELQPVVRYALRLALPASLLHRSDTARRRA